MTIETVIALVAEAVGLVIAFLAWGKKIANGQKCQLRSDMLSIYYHNCEKEEIRQYEYENFVFMYEAYKALKGNSFIDKIYKEVQTWKVIS
jgi:hypothetical protein